MTHGRIVRRLYGCPFWGKRRWRDETIIIVILIIVKPLVTTRN
jgi:hypothetical protein